MGNSVTLSKIKGVSFVHENETLSGLMKIADLVRNDIRLVLGFEPEMISETEAFGANVSSAEGNSKPVYVIFGIAGQSALLDDLSKRNVIDLSSVAGKREVYGFYPVTDGSRELVVIAGSDKRGTIYGLFHLSELLGVSPLVNWSNVIPAEKEYLELSSEDTFVSKEPSVEYRGFFINDEWPAFGNWCFKHFGGINCEMYKGVFELLLRMKGNYLWPAMWTGRFAMDGPGLASAELADELGVVMGLSHHEPCLRHGEEYRYVRGPESIYGDAWDFRSNEEGITRFWRDGLKRNGHLENIITIGMRGENDSKILGENATLKDNIDLLRGVLKTQNQLIREEVNENLKEVPRMLALYKEVEPFYYGNDEVEGLMDNPELEDVILMLCDDNHGYVRSLPDEKMRKHSGGFGMYYHFDYHGDPISYEWNNSTYLPEVWEQMTTAYEYGIKKLWIVNVGDLGLQEMPLSYFLDLAYDYEKYGINTVNKTSEYMEDWMRKQFGEAFDEDDLKKLSDMYTRYTRLMHNRRPEHLNDKIYKINSRYEAKRILEQAEEIIECCKELEAKCCDKLKDAFTELISYNVLGGMNLVKMWIYTAYNHYFASLGMAAANDFGQKVIEAMDIDRELTENFHRAADGKWDGFGLAEHIGFRYWNSEECANPVVATVFPVKRGEIMAGLLGDEGATSGQDWTKKKLIITEYLVENDEYAEAEMFLGLTGSVDVDYSVTSDYNWIRTDRESGRLTPEDNLHYLRLTVDKTCLTKEEDSDKITSGTVFIRYPLGTIEVQLSVHRSTHLHENDGMVIINADEFCESKPSQDGKEFVVLDALGRDENAIKVFPVTENCNSPENAPYVEYEFDMDFDGRCEVIFQLEPTNPFRFGKRMKIAYLVNSDDTSEVKFEHVVSESYAAGVTEDWMQGVLNHARNVSAYINCRKGRNRLRFYGMDMENVLEKIIILREGRELPSAYLL
ncbi:MAG: glycosyl hydrolase 115 family protein [Eubacterium sp.]|nr:glycosyl hydrolase 115 family protein [Eubacterium sp.]